MAADQARTRIFIGNIVHSKNRYQTEYLNNGFLIVKGSKILAVGLEPDLENAIGKLRLDKNTPKTILTKSQILIPGFVDCHIHAPQYPNCGLGYDEKLLDWLQKYTYPLEMQLKDEYFSQKVYDAIVKKTIQCGTTTACYFGSLYNNSCNILVDVIVEHGQRAFVGKLNMIQLAPEEYLETPDESIKNTLEFIKNVQSKKTNLVQPIITPRFALSVTMPFMTELSSIAKSHDLHIQTHISENTSEVDAVQTQYGMKYATVYDEANLLTPKTILAHGIYLTDEELKLISKRGSAIAHCPDSNLCLRSGTFNVRQAWDYGISVGLGSDVSGGTIPSMLQVMRVCYYSSVHLSFLLSRDYQTLTFEEVFYLGTLGGAEALALQNEIGNFEVNKEFDALIVDMDTPDAIHYLKPISPIEILQKFVFSGDDRNIVAVYVAGRLVKSINKC